MVDRIIIWQIDLKALAGALMPTSMGVANSALALRAGSSRSSTSMGELVGAVDSCPGAALAGVVCWSVDPPAPRAGFWCIYGSSLGAAGLVAGVVRDALGRLLMGLVHG